jgi:hypothetical protein
MVLGAWAEQGVTTGRFPDREFAEIPEPSAEITPPRDAWRLPGLHDRPAA